MFYAQSCSSALSLPSTVTVPPPVEPLTLEEVKLDRRVDHDLDDALLSMLIQAAREFVQGYCGTSLVTQTREVSVPLYTEGMVLPYGPVQSVTAPPESVAPFTVEYVAGYPPVDPDAETIDYVGNIPASFKVAMKLLIGDWYENRENTIVGTTVGGPVQFAVRALLDLQRRRLGIA